jgi:hypothetical protein
MANFTTESDVRDKFQLTDTTLVPSALVTGSIDDAHTELLRYLDPIHDVPSPDNALVMGETLLAGAHLYRSLASHDAFDLKRLSLGGQRIEDGERFRALMIIAEASADCAWMLLEPYLLEQPPREVFDVNASTPVLGEE